MWNGAFALICLGMLFTILYVHAAPWIAPDWAGKEPQYRPGSLYWKTNEYPNCPVVYRAVFEPNDEPMSSAGIRIRASQFAYVFLNGHQIASYVRSEGDPDPGQVDVELGNLLKPGRNVLVVSTTAGGFSLAGYVKYGDGSVQHFASDTQRWKAQKLPPLTMTEHEAFMKPDFDDAEWFLVMEAESAGLEVSDAELEQSCHQLTVKRLEGLDKDARWRLKMLAERGIAVVNWTAYSWAGAGRLPEWLIKAARQASDAEKEAGWYHNAAEALAWYVRLSDDAANLENHVTGLAALKSPSGEIEICKNAAGELRELLKGMKGLIQNEEYDQAATASKTGEAIINRVRSARITNDLSCCLDNKFSWLDTNDLMDNDIAGWGLSVDSPAVTFASPLSTAVHITTDGKEFVMSGWSNLEPLKVYKKPANLGPICLWVVLNGKVTSLVPGDDRVAYDRAVNGELSENWALLVNNFSSGGHLPVELVFLQPPAKISFKAGEKGTEQVTVIFEDSGAQLFALRPLKEWRGLLHEARVMNEIPLKENEARQYIDQCRFWSKAVLNYPVTFSEVFVRDPQNRRAILCADVYNYREYEDEWNTKPIRIAPLPPLATYGLMMEYPGLEVVSEAQTLGSRGLWGDHIAVVDQNYVVYRVPVEKIKRFGGFTSYCFGGTDIGGPGSITEIDTIKLTGSNSFRPQHNQTGERAMKTLQWCWERGLQNVFNTDEKWVPDVVEHFRILAQKCKDYPPDAVAYDLLNEPETRNPADYDALIKKITTAIREVDKTHLIYVEVFPPWGPSASPFPRMAFENLTTTGDELTCYSFHDYEYRLPPRWPNEEHDIRDIISRWIPAFKYGIDSRRPIHLGEFGGFEQTDQSVYDNPCALTMMMDYLRIFDQFGWHWHYYANRGTVRVRRDGSLQESYVQEAHRQYFAKGTFNVNR